MFKSYFRIAWRNLLKRKVFATINILGLALGFGSSILLYLFMTHHLSFDKFHENSERIYRFTTEEHRDLIDYEASVPPGFAKVFRDNYEYSEKVAKMVIQWGLVLDVEKSSGVVSKFKEDVQFVEEDFFKIFNFPLINGTNSVPLSAPNTAVITSGVAQKMFGTTNAVGKTFILENDITVEVTGVLQNIPRTSFLQSEVFVSFESLPSFFGFAASEAWVRITSNLQCFTRLKPNQDPKKIEDALLALPKEHRPKSKNKHVYKLQPLSDIHFNPLYGGTNPILLWIFGIIGVFLITIGCINFINISTAQAFYRSKEIGIRKVLGSFKKHLFWQFLSETFVISSFSILLGVALAALFLPAFNHLFEIQLALKDLIRVEFFAFLLLLLILVAFLSGSYPGILISRIVPVLALKGKLNHNDTGGNTTRKILVVAQFAISIILIASTLIISRQIDYATNTDLGFDKESIVMVEIPTEIERVQFEGLKERLKKIPGVQNVSACLSSPGAAENNWGTSVKYDNRPENEEFSIQAKIGDVDYLKTFSIPLVAGRNFFKSDSITEVLVNEKFGEKVGVHNPEELLGKKLFANGQKIQATIVGVVQDFHDTDFTEEIRPAFIGDHSNWYGEIAIKINHLNTKSTLDQIDQKWTEAFSGYIFDYRFLDERVAEEYETEQRYLSLSKVFSALAIFIGCLGLYGLILFFVGQRTKEIGIRKVLGSTVANILTLFTVDFFKLILIAGLVATPVAWYLMEQWLQGYIYRTQIRWWVFALSIGSVMAITLLTISYQTLRAATANPIRSLRTE